MLRTLRRLVGTRFQVLFHDPSPGHFSPFPHGTSPLSVTRKYLGLPGGPGRFTRDFTGPVLLGNTPRRHRSFVYRTLTVYGQPSQTVRLPQHFVTPHPIGRSGRGVPQPRIRNACRLSHAPGLASSAFAHHYSRNHCCFLFLRVLRCFTSPRSHQPPYFIQTAATPHDGCQVSPFGNPRIKVWLPTPRGISQAPTSFIGS